MQATSVCCIVTQLLGLMVKVILPSYESNPVSWYSYLFCSAQGAGPQAYNEMICHGSKRKNICSPVVCQIVQQCPCGYSSCCCNSHVALMDCDGNTGLALHAVGVGTRQVSKEPRNRRQTVSKCMAVKCGPFHGSHNTEIQEVTYQKQSSMRLHHIDSWQGDHTYFMQCPFRLSLVPHCMQVLPRAS